MPGVEKDCKNAFSAVLRGAAEKAGTGRGRVRLVTIANLLDGMPAEEAAEAVGSHSREVEKWLHEFMRAGLKAMRDRRGQLRPRRLSVAEDRAVERLLVEKRDCTVPELCAFVLKRFGVTYSASGMKYHVEKCLGFRWRHGRVVRRRRSL